MSYIDVFILIHVWFTVWRCRKEKQQRALVCGSVSLTAPHQTASSKKQVILVSWFLVGLLSFLFLHACLKMKLLSFFLLLTHVYFQTCDFNSNLCYTVIPPPPPIQGWVDGVILKSLHLCVSIHSSVHVSSFVQMICPEPLNHFLPNLVWWYIIMRGSVMNKNWFTIFNVKVKARADIIKQWLFYYISKLLVCLLPNLVW